MAYIQVYFNDELKDEVELSQQETTIGRGLDAMVHIDNAGVSSLHATIYTEGDSFIIQDEDSKNGVLVNGEKVLRCTIRYGDEITIFKHRLRLSAIAAQSVRPHAVSHDTHAIAQDKTMEIDTSDLGDLVKQRQQKKGAYLLMNHAVDGRLKYPIDKLIFTLGKDWYCDLPVPGWFAPGLAARIKKRNDAFYLEPLRRAKARINGVKIVKASPLEDGDLVSVRNLTFKFYNS